jgi:hypothetical protein
MLQKVGSVLMLLVALTTVKHRIKKVVAVCILITVVLFIIVSIAGLKLAGDLDFTLG